jgi:hypothetical protein
MSRQLTKFIFFISLFFFVPQIAQAGFLDNMAYCTKLGNCDINDIGVALSFLIKYLLGMMGAVALVYFVWGGIQWLISGGNAERVNRGKQIMINTVMAIFLAFGGYLITSFFVNDVLNVTDYTDESNNIFDFSIQEGDAGIECKFTSQGQSCGPYKQCSDNVGTYNSPQYICEHICSSNLRMQVPKLFGGCVRDLGDYIEYTAAQVGWCPPDLVCAHLPPSSGGASGGW